jgi:hypothetical protein
MPHASGVHIGTAICGSLAFQAARFMSAGVTSLKNKNKFQQLLLQSVLLSPEVNFTNILCSAFTRADHKRAKNTVKYSVFCAFGIWVQKSWA